LVNASFRSCSIRSTLIDYFDIVSVGPSNYVVVVLHVGGSKASNIKLISKRESRTSKTWFPAGSILPNEEHVDAAVRKKLALL
jgi:8-oxo-dGTP pyrophosphatase MutT (NUDIX family)